MSEITLKLKTPEVPNFIIVESCLAGLKQDGFRDSLKVSIADLSSDQLKEIAKEWENALIEKAMKLRGSR